MTTSATPTPTGTSPSVVASTARATDPTPNHWFAGLSRVHECAAVSASGVPNGRPITAVAVWYTGSPPGAAAGKRTRSIRSLPIDPDRRVRNSTRSAPSHSRVSAVIVRSPSGKVATSRDPAGERCARTAVAGAAAEPAPGPFGDRCQGPSPQRGCLSYSSCSTSSLPGPASTSRPDRLSSTELSVPPRAGSAVTAKSSFSIVTPSTSVQPGPPPTGTAGTAASG